MELLDAKPDAARTIELLCDGHQRAALECWPVFSNEPNALFDRCYECRRAVRRRFPGGRWYVRVIPDFEPELFEESNAFHEAAHTVGAVLAGHGIRQVSIERHNPRLDASPAGGTALHGPYEVPVLDHLAMTWAGQRAGRRWLALKGLDTPANLIDINHQGIHDLQEIAHWTNKYELPPDAGREQADRMLDRYWPEVETVAARLCAEYVLPRQSVHELLASLAQDNRKGA